MWQSGITLTKDLDKRQTAAKFVLCLLNADQKQK
jgi:hypothetical protein